jgi:hypothetical protein
VGLFSHYLNANGTFTPSIAQASQFVSKEMADIMAKKYGGSVEMMKK